MAREAGVSRALVSMALGGTGRVSEHTRSRIVEAAERIGYARNLSAASLASNSSPVVGVILPDLRNLFFEDLVSAVQRYADQTDLLPLLATASNEVRREELVMKRFRELNVRGVITVSPAVSREALLSYGRQMPLVVIGERALDGSVDTLCLDEDAAAHRLVGHLAGRGWDRLAYVYDGLSQRDRGLAWRRRALTAAAADAGLRIEVRRSDEGVADVVSRLCEAALGERMAIVAHNDLLASEIASAVRSHGLVVGSDVAVAGYDDTAIARRSQADLTSVGQSTAQQGGTAVNWVASRATFTERPARHLALPPSLSVRAST